MWVKLGVIIPSSNTTVEREFSRSIIEPDITIHASRIMLREVTLKGLEEMERETERAAQELNTAKVNIVAYACTTGSLFKGPNHHVEIKHRIENIVKVPAVATSGAVVDALKHFNAHKVLIITPYVEELNIKEREFLEKHGFNVVSIRGLGISDNTIIGSLDPNTAYETAVNEAKRLGSDYDALFISCTNWRTFEVIGGLERQLGKPVISSNSATLWSTIMNLGIRVKLKYELGSLFNDISR